MIKLSTLIVDKRKGFYLIFIVVYPPAARAMCSFFFRWSTAIPPWNGLRTTWKCTFESTSQAITIDTSMLPCTASTTLLLWSWFHPCSSYPYLLNILKRILHLIAHSSPPPHHQYLPSLCPGPLLLYDLLWVLLFCLLPVLAIVVLLLHWLVPCLRLYALLLRSPTF